MIFVKNNKLYISKNKSRQLFNINDAKIESVELDTFDKHERLEDFIEYNERIISLLKFLNNFDGKAPKIYGRVYKNFGKNTLLQKEFYSHKDDELDKSIGRMYGDVLVEFIILDESVDVQKLLEFGKFNKVKVNIYHFHKLEDNDVYLSSKLIHKLYIPTYITNMPCRKD